MRATFFATLEIAWTASAKVVGINTGLRMSATVLLLEPTFKYLTYGSSQICTWSVEVAIGCTVNCRASANCVLEFMAIATSNGQVPQLGLGNLINNFVAPTMVRILFAECLAMVPLQVAAL